MNKHLKLLLVLAIAALAPVGALAQEEQPERPTQQFPFFIYKDSGFAGNHYTPSGYMGDYSDIALNYNYKKDVRDGESCIRVKYNAKATQKERWAGVYWQDPPNVWGTVSHGGYNLQGAKKLKFLARGDKGGEIVEFAAGGIPGEFPDSFVALGPPQTLTSEWKEYEIDVQDYDLSTVHGGFRFVLQQEKHPEGAVFYIDNIRFE